MDKAKLLGAVENLTGSLSNMMGAIKVANTDPDDAGKQSELRTAAEGMHAATYAAVKDDIRKGVINKLIVSPIFINLTFF